MTPNRDVREFSERIRTFERPNCPACGRVGKELYSTLIDACFDAPGEWCYSKCEAGDCGALWLNPAPVAEDLLYAYRNYHTHGGSREHTEGLIKNIYSQFVRTLFFITGVQSERKRGEWMSLDALPPGSLLDVGCGRGEFLARMASFGWKATGVDFDPEAADEARRANGVDVRIGGIECIDPTTCEFDAITSNHSIEHVHDPLEFLKACRRLLSAGGRLVIRTPNADSFGHQRYQSAWRGLEPPRHLCILTIPAIRTLAKRAGLTVIECSTSPAMAEGILLASRFIKKYGRVDSAPKGVRGVLSKLVGPVLAIYAHLEWRRNDSTGEELYVVLGRDEIAAEG